MQRRKNGMQSVEKNCKTCLFYEAHRPDNGYGLCFIRSAFDSHEFATVKQTDNCPEWGEPDDE